ncbi:alpha/beta-hydrolase [Cucurbitaria berberidis CBS 394.84]|uniref:Alpha/beta-hydrolase n=1 Tax=Cucurbitaria berberidis CBS 394.84 TaxID=1168544 RepID=A0A9P4GLA8_9PLEO|nr:alpha/beta-hydrolase [Cucurbitaria berberidis CBS 394.84]KAF1847544.1 alpha/beta-hydrolase [Cucurbitaria berberidis CBS 394.84]
MDAFEKKTLKTSRGYTYTYYVAEGDKSLPTLFFQHGWPDHAAMWKDVAGPLRSTKHPIIIPDLLGYAGTDKPTDPAEYKWDVMTKDLIEIMDNEKANKVISIGHDWGSASASRLYHYHPDRVVGLVILNVGYMAPSREPFDLDTMNKATEQAFGYPLFSYWTVFAADDGPALLKENIELMYNAMHSGADTLKKIFTGTNAMREYLTTGNAEFKLRPYAQDPQFKQAFIERMARDGFEGPQCWYKATAQNFQTQCDSKLPEGVDKVDFPVLYIGGKDDSVFRPEAMYPAIQAGLLPKLEQTELIDAAHWVMYDKPGELVTRLEAWLKNHYA